MAKPAGTLKRFRDDGNCPNGRGKARLARLFAANGHFRSDKALSSLALHDKVSQSDKGEPKHTLIKIPAWSGDGA
jgi:hypothetical protein